MLRLQDFDYLLPKELIAQKPHQPRDQSRLLLLNRQNGFIEHKRFDDLVEILKPGDVLVINDSKVFPARLLGTKKKSGGKVEVFLHKERADKLWECLVRGKVRLGLVIEFSPKLAATLIKDQKDGTWLVSFNLSASKLWPELNRIGKVPLPPYITPDSKKKDKLRYQTVFAENNGSVAAPTAGLHFSQRLLDKLKKIGVVIIPLTLHVGLGTFSPVKENDIKKHKMHSEEFFLSLNSLKDILKAKKEKRRIFAVGTTTCRVLESLARDLQNGKFIPDRDYQGETDIFIYPGYEFKLIDALITNFHLPKSTLLMLISAFAGSSSVKKAYQEAVNKRYRFYSYGDAMLII